MTRHKPIPERGFTLLELMAVVIIIGVLSTLAVYGVRKYVYASKTTEAIHMIGSIKSAEESYKSETFKYAGVDRDKIDNSGNFYPGKENPSRKKWDWNATGHDDYAAVWGPLGVQSDSPVIFEYIIVAGGPAQALPKPGEFSQLSWGDQGASAPGPWYVVVARADQDGDGKMSCFTSSNLTGEIFSVNDIE